MVVKLVRVGFVVNKATQFGSLFLIYVIKFVCHVNVPVTSLKKLKKKTSEVGKKQRRFFGIFSHSGSDTTNPNVFLGINWVNLFFCNSAIVL